MLNEFNPRQYYAENYEQTEVEKNVVLYESRDGSAISDSPLALFLSIVGKTEFCDFKHIWVVKELSDESIFVNVPQHLRDQIRLVLRNSKEYVDDMLTANYLITNSTFQSWFSKKEDQVYINTWHGTPLKAMGFDIETQVGNTQNVLRNLLMTDYFLSPNAHTTEIFAGSGYKLRGLYPGEIIETGYPRIDLTKNTTKLTSIHLLQSLNIQVDSELPIVVYMPTWRGSDTSNPSDSITQIVAELLYLRDKFEGQYQILLKVHPYLFQKAKQNQKLSGILIDDVLDANLVLASADILITDFSSVFFDYLVTDKPIIFYTWDQDIYQEERGMYLEMDELPGPVLTTIFEVSDYLSDINGRSKDYLERYESAKQKFVSYDDGNVSDRVVDYIFNQTKASSLTVKKVDTAKKKLLFYPGNLANNGITNSFINLTNSLDFQKFDVTVFVNTPNTLFIDNYKRLNKNLRLIFRTGAPNFSKKEQTLHDRINKSGNIRTVPEVAFKRESKRLFSGIVFDTAIDFSGYSFYWAKFIAFSTARYKMIFQHNDLYEEMTKEIDGKFPHKNLTAVFDLYTYFDKVISASRALKEVNAQKLKRYINPEKLDYLPNIISFGSLQEKGSTQQEITHIDGIYTFIDSTVTIYRKPIFDINYRILSVSNRMIVKVVALKTVNEVTMVKILIDDIYYGWVDFTVLQFSGNITLEEKKVSKVASFVKNKNYFLYKTQPMFIPDQHDLVITESKYLTKQYWFIRKEVKTRQGKLAYISNKMGIKGWVRYEALTRVHRIKQRPHLALGFWIHNLRNQVITSGEIKFEKFYFKLNSSIENYYTSSPLLTMSKKTTSDKLDKQVEYLSDEQQLFKGQYFVKASANNQMIGWIREQDIEEIDKKNIDRLNDDLLMAELNQINHNRSNQIPQFINVGRLSPEKNQKQLIEAFADLITSGVNAKLYILGSGVLEDELRTMIINLNLTESVKLLGHIENCIEIMKLMDYFVFPSRYEGQGMALIEAMSVGLIPITSDIPTSREILKDGKFGIICETNDKLGLVNAMKKALNNAKEYPKFGLEQYNEKTIEMINQVLTY